MFASCVIFRLDLDIYNSQFAKNACEKLSEILYCIVLDPKVHGCGATKRFAAHVDDAEEIQRRLHGLS